MGFQLHFGPAAYDDPNEVASYVVPPGASLTGCLFRKLPIAVDTHVGAIRGRTRLAMGQFTAYTQAQAIADSTAPEACNQGVSFVPLVEASSETFDFAFEGTPPAPEYRGAALRLPAAAQAVLQAYSYNPTDQPRLAEAWVNFFIVADSDVKLEVGPIAWLGGLGMNVPPHTAQTVQSTCSAQGTDMQVLALTAHTLSHTQAVRVSLAPSGGTAKKIYESYDWQKPALLQYDSLRKNPAPDPITKTPGGWSGDLVAPRLATFSWECDVNNGTDLRLQFSDLPVTGEMCNVFGFYAPATSSGVFQCLSF